LMGKSKRCVMECPLAQSPSNSPTRMTPAARWGGSLKTRDIIKAIPGMIENWAHHPRTTARLLLPMRAKSSMESVMPIRTITAERARVIKPSLKPAYSWGRVTPRRPASSTYAGKYKLLAAARMVAFLLLLCSPSRVDHRWVQAAGCREV